MNINRPLHFRRDWGGGTRYVLYHIEQSVWCMYTTQQYLVPDIIAVVLVYELIGHAVLNFTQQELKSGKSTPAVLTVWCCSFRGGPFVATP